MKVIARLMARGIGSTLPRKNAYPILGRPMLWRFLKEIKKAAFIDEIFVWTEDSELADITNECDCSVIPREMDQVFYHGGFSDPDQWDEEINQYIIDQCGTLGDIQIFLNCNYCLMTADILEDMFDRLMESHDSFHIRPITKIDPSLFMVNPKTGYLFPIWVDHRLHQNEYPDLYRICGIVMHFPERALNNANKVIYHEVAPEYLLDVDSVEDVRLAEYYLMRRMGGKLVLPGQKKPEMFAIPPELSNK